MSRLDQWSDGQLLHDESDPAESFSVVYRRHLEAVLRFAASRGLPAEVAADLAHDTFVTALKKRHRYRPAPDAPDGARRWILSIAHKKMADNTRRWERDTRRQAAIKSGLELSQRDRDGYAALLEASSTDALAALDGLPEVQRAAIEQRVLEHREYDEIARDLGLREGTTRRYVSRGLARLRSQLERTP